MLDASLPNKENRPLQNARKRKQDPGRILVFVVTSEHATWETTNSRRNTYRAVAS